MTGLKIRAKPWSSNLHSPPDMKKRYHVSKILATVT